MYKYLFFCLFLCQFLVGTAQIGDKIKKVAKDAEKVATGNDSSDDETSLGLKDALLKGIDLSTAQASAENGFFLNKAIKIPFPPDAKNVATALKKVGMDEEVRTFVQTLNRSAELAAGEAKPIFVNAVKSMSFDDAAAILTGDDQQGATNYLKRKTSDDLAEKFRPIIDAALDKTEATRLYGDLISAYNKLPFVEKKDPDLSNYAVQKTMDGLFYLVGQEEMKIRKDPAARTTELLKKIFN